MGSMGRRTGLRVLTRAAWGAAAVLGLLAGTLAGSATATAAPARNGEANAAAVQGPDRCPRGDFCLFTGPGGTGRMYTYRSATPDTGWAGRHAVSWANRTPYYSRVFEATHYRWAPPPHNDGYWWTGPATSAGYGWGTAQGSTAQYRDHMLSVNLAPSAHECWTTHQYVDWYPNRVPNPSPSAFGALVTGGLSDLVMRSMEGHLWVLDGYGHARDLGGGWNGMTALVRHGDFTGDGNEDILARDGSGRLWVYPGDGHGGLGPRRLIGTGWNAMTALVGVGDLTGNYWPSLVARDRGGNLWVYPANGRGGFGARHRAATGVPQSWQLVAAGDVDGDGHNDLYAFDSSTLHLYLGDGAGRLKPSPTDWNMYVAAEPGEYYF